MDQWVFSILGLIGLLLFSLVSPNTEGDALNALKTNLADPNNVLQSWDPTLVNPCTWLHVTCNSENSVTRVDLGNANLSGQLVPQLGQLQNLQYFSSASTILILTNAYAGDPVNVECLLSSTSSVILLLAKLIIGSATLKLARDFLSVPISKELVRKLFHFLYHADSRMILSIDCKIRTVKAVFYEIS